MPVDKGGGNARHRDGCQCFACVRKAKALALATGSVPPGLGLAAQTIAPRPDVLEADILEVPGRTIRDRIGQWMELRREDPSRTNVECAKLIGIAPQTLNTYISKAHREGWLRFSEPLARIEHEIIPQTIDNLAFYLSKEGGRDKQVTIETAKGMIFKQFLDSKGVSEAPQTVLALKIESIAPDGLPSVKVSGNVVGAPRLAPAPPVLALDAHLVAADPSGQTEST